MAKNLSWAVHVACKVCGTIHFGKQGAAGIAIVRRDVRRPGNPATHIVLQLRNDTNTWGLPGGILDYGETPRQAAFREAEEEVSLRRNADQGNDPLITIRQEAVLLDHSPFWRYTTFIADLNRPFQPIRPPTDFEGKEVALAPIDEIGVEGGRYFPLLPAFGQTWDRLRDLIRAMDGPAQPVQPVNPPVNQPIDQPVDQPVNQPANSTDQHESGTVELTIGFPVTVPGTQPPSQNPQVNPGFQPTTPGPLPPAPPDVAPSLGFQKTTPGPQTGRNVQGINPAQGVNPTPPPTVTATPGTTLDDVGTPGPSDTRIVSDDEDHADSRTSPGEVKGNNGAPGGHPVSPHVQATPNVQGIPHVQGTPHVQATPHVPDPPYAAPSPSVESNPDDEMEVDDGKPHVQGIPHVQATPDIPDPPYVAPSPSVESNPDDEMEIDEMEVDDMVYVPLRGTADPSWAGGPIRYMSWTKQTKAGSQCQPS